MNNFYKIDTNLLDSVSNSLSTEKTSFVNGTRNIFSTSYLANCSDSEIQSMKNKLNEQYSTIEKSYNSIANWLNDYISDANSVEQCLISGKNNIKDREVSREMDSILKNKEVEIEVSPVLEVLINNKPKYEKLPLITNKNSSPSNSFEPLPFITGPNEKQNNVELYGADQMVYRPGIDKNEIDDMVYRKGKEHATLELYSDEMEKPEYDERGFEINKTEEIDLEAIKEENQALLDSIEPIRIDLENQIAELDKELETLSELKKKYISSKDDTPYNPNDPEYQRIVKRLTEILEKRRELAESLSTILMFEQQVQNNLDLIPYMEIEMSDDYKKFVSEYEASKEYIGPDALKTGVNRWDHLADYEKNGEGGYVYKLREGEFETEIKVEDFSKYATEAEKNMYHYLCQTQSLEKANEYLLKKVDQINMMKGAELANYDLSEIKTTIAEEENADSAIEAAWAGLKNSFQAWGMGLLDGTENFATGFAKWFSKDKHMSAEQYSKIIVAQYLTEHKYGTHYEVGTVTGNLLPAIAVSLVSRSAALGMALPAEVAATYGQFAGVVSMGLSAGGNAKEYAMQHLGATESSALLYGLLIGTSESVLGRFLGKIPGLSAEAGLSIKSLLMEGLEEWSQDWIAAGLQAVMYDKEINFDELNEESMKSFFMGVLMAGAMNGANATVDLIINGQSMQIDVEYLINKFEEGESVEDLYNSLSLDGYVAIADNVLRSKGKSEAQIAMYKSKYGNLIDYVNFVANAFPSSWPNLNTQAKPNVISNGGTPRVVGNNNNNNNNSLSTAEISNLKKLGVPDTLLKNYNGRKIIKSMNFDGEVYVFRLQGRSYYIQTNFDSTKASYNVGEAIKTHTNAISKYNEMYKKVKEFYYVSDYSLHEATVAKELGLNGNYVIPQANSNDAVIIYGRWETSSTGEIIHEGAHNYDRNDRGRIGIFSGSKEYIDAVAKDGNYPSTYAEKYYETYKNYTEDWADFCKEFRKNPQEATEKYPNRVSYLKNYHPKLYHELLGK